MFGARLAAAQHLKVGWVDEAGLGRRAWGRVGMPIIDVGVVGMGRGRAIGTTAVGTRSCVNIGCA